jgi:hypothetical protein
MEGRKRRGGRREERARRAARGRRRSLVAGRCPPATDAIATCAIPDLLLKHQDETFAKYARRKMKTLETCVSNTCKNT